MVQDADYAAAYGVIRGAVYGGLAHIDNTTVRENTADAIVRTYTSAVIAKTMASRKDTA